MEIFTKSMERTKTILVLEFFSTEVLKHKKSFAFIKAPKSTEILDKLEKKKKLEKNKLIFRNRGKEKIVFETDDSIVNYLWSSNDEFIYVITKEWSSRIIKKLKNKTDHPLEIDKLPFDLIQQELYTIKISYL